MSNENRGSGKSKKIIVGIATVVATAAIAVPTALTLAGGNGNAGASNSNKYNVVISSGIDGMQDYSLTIDEGTKISELKSLLKGIDGYKITGIYKDEAMQHEYADNETINGSIKVYIQFTAVTYVVNVYNEDGTSLIETQEVNHKDGIVLAEPSKEEDNFATYEFAGWVNERGEIVNLNSITSDLNIRPSYKTIMKEYKIGFVNSTSTNAISVSVGGVPVTLNSTYHYGSTIKLRATQNYGNIITEFRVSVGGEETINILSDEYRHEENGVIYYEIELEGNGDLSITYSEAAAEYSLGEIPDGVTVKRNDEILTSNAVLHYGDLLEITYNLFEDHTLNNFEVSGAEFVQGTNSTYKVVGETQITFDCSYLYSYLTLEKVSDGYRITAFDASTNEVIIPNTYKGEAVTEIANNAFENSSITKLTIGENIKTIGKEVFKGCTMLSEINYNAIDANDMLNLETGELSNAFLFVGNDTNGTIVNIGDGVKRIPAGLFYSDDNLSRPTEADWLRLSNITEINIAESVTEIGLGAFATCANLRKINLPSGLKAIEEGTFAFCYNLELIKLPEGLTTIGPASFSECKKLKSINIPEGVTSIGENVFYRCEGLTEIVIPSTVEGIAAYAFQDCRNLSSVIIKDGVKTIGKSAFAYCQNLRSITLGEGLISIEDRAFYLCDNLQSITIPSTVKTLGKTVFAFDANNVLNVTINSRDIYLIAKKDSSSDDSLLLFKANEVRVLASIDDGTNEFLNSYEKTTDGEYNVYDLTQQAQKHAYLTFAACEGGYEVTGLKQGQNVTEIEIPATYNGKNVVSIKANSFENSNMTKLTIGENIKTIGKEAFKNCTKLTEVNYNAINANDMMVDEYVGSTLIAKNIFANIGLDTAGVNIVIGDSVQKIPVGIFVNIENDFKEQNITNISIGINVTEIGEYAFMSSKISSLNLPNNVTNISPMAFYQCTNLTEISMSNNISIIGDGAFGGCNLSYNIYNNGKYFGNEENPYIVLAEVTSKDITSFKINDNCKFILGAMYPDGGAFGSCKNLTSVEIPTGVRGIGGRAFTGCTSLTSIHIPEGVTSIGTGAFNYCTSLSTISIPNSLTNFGIEVFESCSKLQYNTIDNMKYLGNAENPYLILYRPTQSASNYKINENCKFIYDNAFRGYNVSSIILPAGLIGLGKNVFYDCNKLTSIIIPANVSYIGYSTFYNCTGLTSVTFINQTGWKADSQVIDVSNSAQNAEFIKNSGCTLTRS